MSGWSKCLIALLCTFGAVALSGCGEPPENESAVSEQQEGVTSSCGGPSDTSCLGLTLGAVCETTGHCRRDPDYANACDCIMPVAPPPPAPFCHCSDGTAVGSACHLGGTCHVVLGQEIAYCSC